MVLFQEAVSCPHGVGISAEVLEDSMRPIIMSGQRQARVSQLCLCRTDSLAPLRMTSLVSRKTRCSMTVRWEGAVCPSVSHCGIPSMGSLWEFLDGLDKDPDIKAVRSTVC